MSCSPARLSANRQNALKSSGPKSPEGKAASRLNAFRHGMAGLGDLMAPDDDSKVVAERASAFAVELGADCPVGRTLAHRAALLSIRMERASDRDRAAVAERMALARDQFDQGRLDELDDWIKALDGPNDTRPALSALEESPEGVDYLLGFWGELREAMDRTDVEQPSEAARRARVLLGAGLSGSEAIGVRDRIDAEVGRLRLLRDSMIPRAKAIAKARDRAALLASFDSSPEESLARRYEAAAERGMYRALRAIADLRRAPRLAQPPLEAPAKPGVQAPTTPAAPEKPRPISNPLGSFRAEVFEAVSALPGSFLKEVEPAMPLHGPRKKRPDLRKLAASRR